MTEAQVQAALNAWLASVTGQPRVITAFPDQKRPAPPYISTNLIMSGPLYRNRVDVEFETTGSGEDEQITEHPVRDWFWRFSVFAYGEAPTSILRKAEIAGEIHTYSQKLRPLSLFETSAIRNVPEVVENAIERRANFDIEIRGLVRDGLVIDVAETAGVDKTPV